MIVSARMVATLCKVANSSSSSYSYASFLGSVIAILRISRILDVH